MKQQAFATRTHERSLGIGMERLTSAKPFALLTAAILGGVSGCSDAGASAADELTGAASLAIVAAPGVASVSVEFQGPNRVVSRCVAVDGSATTLLKQLPTGSVTVTAAAYTSTTCEGNATWFADPQQVTMARGQVAPIHIVFRPNGLAEVTTSFEDDACAPTGSVPSWSEEFSDSTLMPAWSVWQYDGERHNGQTSPANHFSLTDNAGHLRYFVDPMTHAAAWRDYEPYFASPYYWYDPGLSLERELGGQHWALEVKASYFVPNVVNSAQHEVAVHFDPPGTAGLHCYLDRFSNDDVGAGTSRTNNIFFAGCSIGEEGIGDRWSEWAGLDTTIVRLVRFERDGASLKIRMSADQDTWIDLVAVTIPEAFSCAQQKMLISGAAWFSPQGSYADYDYVHFSRLD
jgi:hypothetical protein